MSFSGSNQDYPWNSLYIFNKTKAMRIQTTSNPYRQESLLKITSWVAFFAIVNSSTSGRTTVLVIAGSIFVLFLLAMGAAYGKV